MASVSLKTGAQIDPLAEYIIDRRSCKEPFEAREVPQNAALELANLGGVVTDPADVAQIKKLTWDAWLTEMHTHRTLKESVDLMRFGKAEINANPDGIDLGGPFLESLMLAGVLTRDGQLDPASTGFKEGVRLYEEMLHATPAYMVLTSAGNTREDQINAGTTLVEIKPDNHETGPVLAPGQSGPAGV